MRKDLLWLVTLLVVAIMGVRLAGSTSDVDEVGSGIWWQQRFKSADRWTVSVVRTMEGAELVGVLEGPSGARKSATRAMATQEYHNLMAALADRHAWGLPNSVTTRNADWSVTLRIQSGSRTHAACFESDGATPDHLALARYIDLENPITSGQLRELSRGEHAILDTLTGYFNDVLNSKMGPPP